VSEHTILLVEDNPPDVAMVREAFPRLDPKLRLQVVPDGEAALLYLSRAGPYSDSTLFPLPELILLDLSLPKFDGFHVLEWVRTHPKFRTLPVIMLATSSYSGDIKRAYAFGANSFITKPSSFNKLVADLKLAFEHWLYAPLRAAA